MPERWQVLAPGKVNLCLYLGPTRADGRHELVTVFESVSLADVLTATAGPGPDSVRCPGVDGENLAARALAALREGGWNGPGLQIEIEKRVPIAAGMGGGSGDAAAVLRLADSVAPVDPELLARTAVALGADVPAQVRPGRWLGTGAGEVLAPAPPVPEHALLMLAMDFGLATPDVFAEADRLDLGEELSGIEAALTPGALHNDLGPAAVSLAPRIGEGLAALRAAGARDVLVSGSGPTVFGVFWGPVAEADATAAAGHVPGSVVCVPVGEEFARPRKLPPDRPE